MNNITINIGKDSKGNSIERELESILVCGCTHSGKSVFLNNVINTILKKKSPQDVKLILVDTKRAEFDIYKDIPHLMCPVINDSKKAITKFRELVNKELMKRHRMLRDDDGWNTLDEYNSKYGKSVPRIIIIIDEFSDITYEYFGQKSLEHLISLGESVGVNVLLSTSICSKKIITKDIKNFVNIKMVGFLLEKDSQYILGNKDAKELKGNGDMIYKDSKRDEIVRVQTSFISTKEIEKSVKSVIRKYPKEEEELILEDSYFEWLTYGQLQRFFPSATIIKFKGIELYPVFIYPIDNKVSLFSSLILGIFESYDTPSYEIDRLEYEYGVNIKGQERYYKKFLLKQFNIKEEFLLEDNICSTLLNLRDCSDIEFSIPFYRNSVKFLPCSVIIGGYIITEIDYLFEYPDSRNEDIYRRLRELFKMVKREEVAYWVWEHLVIIDYCLADLLGEDNSKNEYVKDIKNEEVVKRLKERTAYDILFGEEYI